ncbi:MAG: bifunctional UDP-N-acetylmuramoyl-tripeptide:D-alanyl-D-alanine ligase/alanine racemase [Bacteroidales bacterium]|jgi:alanine racemase
MDLSYSLPEIAFHTNGTLYLAREETVTIKEILIDSRRLIHPEATLFIALVTDRNDGHRYINELYRKGVRNFLVSTLPTQNGTTQETNYENESVSQDANFILVKDTLNALQKLGAAHRSRFSIPVIGITGSNGKTIVKEWLFQLMNRDKKIVRSPKSFNSQIGVPLSVLNMDPASNLALFEAGISLPGEMEKLEVMIRPTIGIITNIGHAHDEGFRDLDQKAKEKLKLFVNSDTLIYCSDHAVIHNNVVNDSALENVRKFTWGREKGSDLHITDIKSTGLTETTIKGIYDELEMSIVIPFIDEASIENAIHCWSLMLYLGYREDVISSRMKALVPIAMRLELKEAINHCSLVNDSYNSDINSLGIALDFLNQQTQHRKKTIILSDILQSGREPSNLYQEISGILKGKGISRIIGIGNEISKQAGQFQMEKTFLKTTEEFFEWFPLSSLHDEAILLKGARIFGFERISRALQQKSHETILEINLDALVHNLNYYRSKLLPGTKTLAMVKAFSYGSGSFEIANLLQFHRVDYLAVAYADEGVELRKAGITLPIMVMNPEEESFDLLLQYNLEPEIYNLRVLGLLEQTIEKQAENGGPVFVHIKIDTGMHRLGFDVTEVKGLIKRIKENPHIRVQSVFSHLAASEDPAEDEFTLSQISCLKEVTDKMRDGLGYAFLTHILNSAGVTRFSEFQMDMVRLGIGLYGVGFNDEEQNNLRNVSTLKTIISQIKTVKAGETIGYNRKGVVVTDRVIAIIPVGYADGFNRRLGNGKGKVMIKGIPARTIGNISMDSCMVDITDHVNLQHDNPPQEGDEVIIFGDSYSVKHMAEDMGTIPYEILTGISRRVKRVYFFE